MPLIFSDEFRIHTYEVDARGQITLPMLCRFMQETASHHASTLGFGYEDLMKNEHIWVLTALRIHMLRYPHWKETLTVQTWPTIHERLYYWRDFKFLNDREEVLGMATTQWVVLDGRRRRPVRNSVGFEFPENPPPPVLEGGIDKVGEILNPGETHEYIVHYHDLDVNKHVNNVRYLEWILYPIPMETWDSRSISDLTIQFQAEAGIGEQLVLKLEDKGNETTGELVREDNRSICRASITWQKES